MTLLQKVLDEFHSAGGDLRMEELSRRMGIQPGALQGILSFCVQKGLLTAEASSNEGPCAACSTISACDGGCALTNRAAIAYRLPSGATEKKEKPSDSPLRSCCH